MPFAFLLAVAAIASGAATTYLYDKTSTFAARLCMGACTGWAMLGLIGFIIASLLGLTSLALVLTAALISTPLGLMWRKREWRRRVEADLKELSRDVRGALARRHDGEMKLATLIFYAFVAVLFWFLFGRAMFVSGGEIYTGVDNNLGDLPFHISIISSFVYGNNFPPEHTEFAGIRLTYPFLVDFVTAMFVRAGASLEGALFWQNYVLALSLVGLLHRYAWQLTKDHLASLIAPTLVLLSGGFGWYLLWQESQQPDSPGLFGLLKHLPHDYTITTIGHFRWGNALTTLLIPQRGLLFGLPLALIVMTLWWQATAGEGEREREKEEKERRAGAGRPGGREGKKKKQPQSASNRRATHAKPQETMWRPATPEREVIDEKPIVALDQATRRFSWSPVPFISAHSAMFAAGIVAALLPLVHAHSFVVLMLMSGCLAWLFPKWWRAWMVFFVTASILAAPQMWWATRDSAVRAESFFGWIWGWEADPKNIAWLVGDAGAFGERAAGRLWVEKLLTLIFHLVNIAWFWLKNTGLFIPLLVAALLWRKVDGNKKSVPLVPRRVLLFYLPFTLCFILPNFCKLSPWAWDNIKVIFYWWMASAPLVALLLAHWWRTRIVWWRGAAIISCGLLMLAGSLDVWRVVSEASEQRIFDRDGIKLAELIKRDTAPRSLILHAPTYNHPVFLTGRRSVMGYGGHLWSQGLDYNAREADLRKMFAGEAESAGLLEQYGVEYVVLSPLEQTAVPVHQTFFERYTKVGEAGAYSLYQTSRP